MSCRHRPAGDARWQGSPVVPGTARLAGAGCGLRTRAAAGAVCPPGLPGDWRIDLEAAMFLPQPLHPQVICAQAEGLPFAGGIFRPGDCQQPAFSAARPAPGAGRDAAGDPLRRECWRCSTHPSSLTRRPRQRWQKRTPCRGLARQSLLNWAQRAEANHRWTEAETKALLLAAGIQPVESSLKVGPGFARFTRGRV